MMCKIVKHQSLCDVTQYEKVHESQNILVYIYYRKHPKETWTHSLPCII